MEIRKSKETLILTQSEKAILSKACDILDEIYEKSDYDSIFSSAAEDATNCIDKLLEDAEVEGGEPSGTTSITILM